jgi:protein TonB
MAANEKASMATSNSNPVLLQGFWAQGIAASLLMHSALAGSLWFGAISWRGAGESELVVAQQGGGMTVELAAGTSGHDVSTEQVAAELHEPVTVQPGAAILEAHRFIEELVGLPDITVADVATDKPAEESSVDLTKPLKELTPNAVADVADSQSKGSPALKSAEQSNPGFVQNAPPIYPPEAVPRRLRGRVTVRLYISEQGQVTNVEIMESSGYAPFDRSTVDAVKKWRSEPAYRDGKPVARTVIVPFNFEP